jgi:NAD(P)-dependent dehydrogenase (short-subunit alcohol dehydrogenase family)
MSGTNTGHASPSNDGLNGRATERPTRIAAAAPAADNSPRPAPSRGGPLPSDGLGHPPASAALGSLNGSAALGGLNGSAAWGGPDGSARHGGGLRVLPQQQRQTDWWRPRPEQNVPRQLRGKVAVVTGAASSLGLGLCQVLLDEGMTVVLGDMDGRAVARAATALAGDGGNVAYQETNVCLLEEVEALRDAALARFGAVHVVCNAAGYGVLQGFLDHSSSVWSNIFDLNVRGVVNGVRAFLPLMEEQDEGHLSSTASQSGLSGDAYAAAYNGSQFAIIGIMESLALELVNEGSAVTTSVLCPTTDDTEVERGLPALDAARAAVEQMKEGRFWLFTHREQTERLMQERLTAMLEDGRLPKADHQIRLT